MTSLSTQLRSLSTAAPVATKSKASLVDARLAADIDAQTLLVRAQASLATLAATAPQLLQFANSLFADALVGQDVLLLDATETALLTKSLNAFLLIVSPHFMHAATIHLFEYLIRRFAIHQRNVDAVMACILPFHETLLFGKFVALLDIRYLTKPLARSVYYI